MIDHDPPVLDRLLAARLAYRVGAAAAERCADLLPALYSGAELARFQVAYARRASDFRTALAIVEGQIAALPTVPIDAAGALRTRRAQCEAMIGRCDAGLRRTPDDEGLATQRQGWAAKAALLDGKLAQMEAGLWSQP